MVDTYTIIDTIFEYRKLPHFSSERRLDVYFSLLIPGLYQSNYGERIEFVASEFPVRKSDNNQAWCMDFLFRNAEKSRVLFVELKTEIEKLNCKQLENYKEAPSWKEIVKGLYCKVKATDSRFKEEYYYLYKRLYQHGLIQIKKMGLDRYRELTARVDKLLEKHHFNLTNGEKNRKSRAIHELYEIIDFCNCSLESELLFVIPGGLSNLTAA